MALTQISTDGIKNGTITGSDLATNVDLVDNQKLRLGTSSEKSEIYNDGDDLFINHTEAGYLQLQGNYGVLIQRHNGTENLLRALSNGAVELFYDNNKKFETLTDGVKITGKTLSLINPSNFQDSTFTLEHGSSTVGNKHTIDFKDQNGSSTQIISYGSAFGSSKDNALEIKTSTTSNGDPTTRLTFFEDGKIQLPDNGKATFGNSNDLQIYHDGSNSYIEDAGTGALLIKSNTIYLTGTNAANDLASFVEGGAASLFYDDVNRLATSTTGIKVNYRIAALGDENTYVNMGSPADTFQFHTGGVDRLFLTGGPSDTGTVQIRGDNNKLQIGASQDLEIYHDGTDSIIKDTRDSGTLRIHADSIAFNDKDVSETMLLATADGSVNLYFNGVKTFETENGGVAVTDDDTTTYVELNTSGGIAGYLHGLNNSEMSLLDREGHYFIKGTKDGSTDLFHDNNKKFETKSFGATITGSLEVTAHVYAPDNGKILLGNAQDFELFHDSSVSIIRSSSHPIAHYSNTRHHFLNADGSQNVAVFVPNGQCELYHTGSLTFETQSGGTKTTGYHTVTTNLFCNDIRSITSTNDDSTSHVSISGRNAAGGHGEYFIVGVSGNVYFGAAANNYNSNPSGNNLNGATTIRVFGGISSNAYQDAHRFGRDADGSIIILQSAGGTEGSISISGSTTSYNTSSDYRLKENIVDIEDGITRLKNLKPKRFNFKKDPSIIKDGFIAHEVSSIVPEAVTGTKDETFLKDEDDNNIKAGDPKYQQMDASKLIPLLTAAVKEAIAKIEVLETEVAALKAS